MVIWSNPARDDLKAIFEYIALDSKFYAKKVIREIIEKAASLEKLPERGRVVPEINDPTIREIFIYSYRLIYQLKSENTEILAIIHGKRDIETTDIPH